MPSGVCKMCLQEENLVSSHLVPRAVYEYCDREGHNPIVLTGDVLMASDRQWQYLPCRTQSKRVSGFTFKCRAASAAVSHSVGAGCVSADDGRVSSLAFM